MKNILTFLGPLLISSTGMAANTVYTMESLFAAPETLVSCKDQTRNDPKDIIYTIHTEGKKLVGSAIIDDANDVQAYLRSVKKNPNDYGNYLKWKGQRFAISINLDISNPTNYNGELSSSFSTNGYADYTDNNGKEIHSALYCLVKKQVVR